MPLAGVPQIIQGSARVAGLKVDEAFVRQAASDAGCFRPIMLTTMAHCSAACR
jgi:hypothetical protein